MADWSIAEAPPFMAARKTSGTFVREVLIELTAFLTVVDHFATSTAVLRQTFDRLGWVAKVVGIGPSLTVLAALAARLMADDAAPQSSR
jgi:hypothetical protein